MIIINTKFVRNSLLLAWILGALPSEAATYKTIIKDQSAVYTYIFSDKKIELNKTQIRISKKPVKQNTKHQLKAIALEKKMFLVHKMERILWTEKFKNRIPANQNNCNPSYELFANNNHVKLCGPLYKNKYASFFTSLLEL